MGGSIALMLGMLAIAFGSLSAQDRPELTSGYIPEGWSDESLNTARNASYMKPEEREMIYEINRVRSDPQRYVQFLIPYLEEARAYLELQGKGDPVESVTTIYLHGFDDEVTVSYDTTRYYPNEDALEAVESLILELQSMKPARILNPHRELYRGACLLAEDKSLHDWNLGHETSDGIPSNKFLHQYAGEMYEISENMAAKGKGREHNLVTPREIVIQLLIDKRTVGRGHRVNLLNPYWTHVATCYGGYHRMMHQWLQEFAQLRDQ